MIYIMTNQLKSINRWHDEDHEECRTFRKKYEIDHEERKGSDNTNFSENIRSLVQQITKNAICTISKIARKQTNRTTQTFPEYCRRNCSAGSNKTITPHQKTTCIPIGREDNKQCPKTFCCTYIRRKQ